MTRLRKGVALLWTMLGIVILTLLGVAANQMARDDRLVGENYEAGQRALYAADYALSQYYAGFKANNDVIPAQINLSVLDSLDNITNEGESDAITATAMEFAGADLKPATYTFEGASVTVTPSKTMESIKGDVYLLEARATVTDSRGRHPPAQRTVRTFAELRPVVEVVAALTAAGGISAALTSDHLHLDGRRTANCGAGTDVAALATPKGNPKLLAKKVHLEPKKDVVMLRWDSTAATYQDLMDSLSVPWNRLTSDATYAGLMNVLKVPSSYADLDALPFSQLQYNSPWPITIVHGSTTAKGHVQGFGLLIVDGDLYIEQQFHWRGVILVGKGLHITGDKAHLHAYGAVATGLNCSPADLASGACRTTMDSKGNHLGVAFQMCDVESALAQVLELKPMTPSRHARFF